MEINDIGQTEWDMAYERGGNICFYPHEEIIRFINRYVRKRDTWTNFRNVMPISESEWEEFASLDLGCGIGRHVNFLDDFGLNPYGIDLSDEAIRLGKEWFDLIDKPKLKERLIVGSVTEIPFKSNFFNICVSCGVLDSMPREVAEQGMNEVKRVLKPGGLFYLDMIIDEKIGNQDIIQSDGYEMNTVQSYSTIERVKEFAKIVGPIIDFNLISYAGVRGEMKHQRAHVIVRRE